MSDNVEKRFETDIYIYINQSVYAVCSQINTKHINTVWAERTVVEC